MKFTVGDESINFFDFDYKTMSGGRIGVSLSGGTDSAILFYMMAKYLKDVTLVPWTSYEESDDPQKERPYTIEAAEAIYDFVKAKFPEADIADQYKFVYDRTDPQAAEEAKAMNVPGWHMYPMAIPGIVKVILMRREEDKAFETGLYGMYVGGLTTNPPDELLNSDWKPKGWRANPKRKTGKIVNWEPRRSQRDNEQLQVATQNRSHYHPFIQVDKKFVRGLYEQEGMMEELYPMTESCTGFAKETNWFTEPCRSCFWCYEKYWAFGSYDGGLTE